MGQLQDRYKSYRIPQEFMEKGVYPYFREITGKQGTEVEMGGHKVLMFGSNAYTGLTGDQRIIDKAKAVAGVKSAKSVVVYVRPEINKVYYVIDDNTFGNFDLF